MSDRPAPAYRHEFQLDPELIYLNHAAVAPWPLRTALALKNFADENLHRGAAHYPQWTEVELDLRNMAAKLINAPHRDDIALLKNTSEALSVVAYGLPWQAGDNIVTSDEEFPSNRIVWQSLRSRGVELRQVGLASAASPEEALLNAMDERTKLLTISSVQYASGLRLDLAKLGAACRQHGIWYCIDAIQSLGALAMDVQACHADFIMADGHKWLLGPEGLALFYCRAELRDQLQLHQYGWHMIEEVGDYDRRDWQVARSARRFECGSPNMLGIYALHASLSLLLEIGMDSIEPAVLHNSTYLIKVIQRHPDRLHLITPAQTGRYAGIVTFRHRSADQSTLFRHLREHGVICALRGGAIRFSPHFYTDQEQLDQAIKLLIDYKE